MEAPESLPEDWINGTIIHKYAHWVMRNHPDTRHAICELLPQYRRQEIGNEAAVEGLDNAFLDALGLVSLDHPADPRLES